MNIEQQRLQDISWKKWGPYLSERQWGTVREDYSANGDAWQYTTHDMARSKAWRWGEDGLAGICDDRQLLCFAIALWNGKDPILKERLFGLTNSEGNHGEDVKELYYYLDATPTHSYMQMLYKYPQQEFPYSRLVEENRRRGKMEPEFELLDTGVFDEDEYFDVFVTYAKATPEDVLINITLHNRSKTEANIEVLPTLWFRNTWTWGYGERPPLLYEKEQGLIAASHSVLGNYYLHCENAPALLFCENETNTTRLYRFENGKSYYKDGIHDHVVKGMASVNPLRKGTKAAAHYKVSIQAGASLTLRLRLETKGNGHPFDDFDQIFATRLQEADAFYAELQKGIRHDDEKRVQRQALAGMLWNKQFYYYDIAQWLHGDPAGPPPPAQRLKGRNHEWKHLNNADIISMPDKWEYPWYAAWDLAFHCIPYALIDPAFAKQQLLLLTREWYMHPNGQLPAYEWNFSDVNPPVHAWVAWKLYQADKKNRNGQPDLPFLEAIFHKLLLNFTWWVNRKDRANNNIFEGGFLGLDNIGVFNRDAPLPTGGYIEQADGTSWMAMYALSMLCISLELSNYNKVYTDLAGKFFEHFLYIAGAMSLMGEDSNGLWDDADEFFYDQIRLPNSQVIRLKIRSMVGLIPLFAVAVLENEMLAKHPEFSSRMDWFLRHRPDLAGLVSRWYEKGKEEKRLLSLLRGHRIKRILARLLDENEFLSDYGVRSLSKIYEQHPYEFPVNGGILRVAYTPAESTSNMFGGNSNWRGPIWLPVNYLIIESLEEFYCYYGDDFKVECPTGSGQYRTLHEVAAELLQRLTKLFLRNERGVRPVFGHFDKLQSDPHFRDYLLFHEYFHGDEGRGLGASHQTGWTGLIAQLLQCKNAAS